MRLVALAGIVFFQLTILGTGNYNFFNLLTIALGLLLVDDAAWARVLPQRLVQTVSADVRGQVLPIAATVTVVGLLTFVFATMKLWATVFPAATRRNG